MKTEVRLYKTARIVMDPRDCIGMPAGKEAETAIRSQIQAEMEGTLRLLRERCDDISRVDSELNRRGDVVFTFYAGINEYVRGSIDEILEATLPLGCFCYWGYVYAITDIGEGQVASLLHRKKL